MLKQHRKNASIVGRRQQSTNPLFAWFSFSQKAKLQAIVKTQIFQVLEHLLGVSTFVLLHIEGLGFVTGSTFYVMPLQ
jgi:hypothetical protein